MLSYSKDMSLVAEVEESSGRRAGLAKFVRLLMLSPPRDALETQTSPF